MESSQPEARTTDQCGPKIANDSETATRNNYRHRECGCRTRSSCWADSHEDFNRKETASCTTIKIVRKKWIAWESGDGKFEIRTTNVFHLQPCLFYPGKVHLWIEMKFTINLNILLEEAAGFLPCVQSSNFEIQFHKYYLNKRTKGIAGATSLILDVLFQSFSKLMFIENQPWSLTGHVWLQET